jgi:phage terminase small subunit
MKSLKVGTKVQWKWLGKPILGQVEAVFKEKTTQVIKGKKIVRNASDENPAYLVKSEAGNLALKLGSELSLSNKETSRLKPKIFSDKN